MKKYFVAVVAAILVSVPSSAYAAAACTDSYYRCLNDTYSTSGLARLLADAGCLALYYSCLKSTVL
jgi:hypothetical protein